MEEAAYEINSEQSAKGKKLIIVVSADRAYAESLRSHLARYYDVLLAKDGGEAAAKSQAVKAHLAVVDLGSPVLGISALGRMKTYTEAPVICALALPSTPTAQTVFDFDYILARPKDGADLPDRVRFILAKASSQ